MAAFFNFNQCSILDVYLINQSLMQKILLIIFSVLVFQSQAQLRVDSILHEKLVDSAWVELGLEEYEYNWYNYVRSKEYKSWNRNSLEYTPSSLIEYDYDNLYRTVYTGTEYWNANDSSYEKLHYSEFQYRIDDSRVNRFFSYDHQVGYYLSAESVAFYNSDGQIIKCQGQFFSSTGSSNGAFLEEYFYNSGNLVEYRSGSSRVYHFYNALGQRDSTIYGTYRDTLKINSTVGYDYNLDGKLMESCTDVYHQSQNLILRKRSEFYTYAEDGRLIEHIYKVSNTSFVWVDVKRWVYHYSEKESNPNLMLELYPRPARSVLFFNNALDASEYSLISVNGQILSNGELQTGMNEFNISNFADGVYVFRVNGEFGIKSERIIITN